MRAVSSSMPLYLHDGFQLNNMVTYVTKNLDKYQPIIVDDHAYFVFTSSQQSTPITSITSQIKSSTKSQLSTANGNLNGNLVIGEMGCANADGQTVSDMDTALKAYCEAQVDVYSEVTAGWIFWAALMADCDKGDGNGWCLLGSAGKYLPTTFAAPSGQISSGGVTITGGSGSSSNSTSTSGGASAESDSTSTVSAAASGATSTSSTTSTKTKTTTGAQASATSGSGGSCQANQSTYKSSGSSSKKRHSKAAAARRRHHSRALQERATDQGYAEGHVAASHFARAGKTLGFTHAYVQARMLHLGVGEEHLEHFKRSFEVGHQEGREAWSVSAAARK